jgi:hypothetical protein
VSSQPVQPVSSQPAPPVPQVTPQPDMYGTTGQAWPPEQPVSGQPAVQPQSDWPNEPVSPRSAPPLPQLPPQPVPQATQVPTPWAAQATHVQPVAQSWPQEHAAGAWQPEQAAGGEAQQRQPRIEPSPPKRGGLLIGLLIGLLAGLVVFAPSGYFVGDQLFGTASKESPGPVQPSASATSLPVYEATQAELNRPLFSGDMAAMAEPWLPYLSRCVKTAEGPGAKLPVNERLRIACQVGGLSVFFVEFKTADDRDQEYLTRKQQNTDSQQLAPGAAAPTRKSGASGKNHGDYVEFAFKPTTAGAVTYAGIWWNREGVPLLAARIEAAWATGLNQKWEPLRDLWQRCG